MHFGRGHVLEREPSRQLDAVGAHSERDVPTASGRCPGRDARERRRGLSSCSCNLVSDEAHELHSARITDRNHQLRTTSKRPSRRRHARQRRSDISKKPDGREAVMRIGHVKVVHASLDTIGEGRGGA